MKLLKVVMGVGILVLLSGCGSNVAMNMYKPSTDTIKVSGVKGQITPQVIEEVKKRRERYIRLHGKI